MTESAIAISDVRWLVEPPPLLWKQIEEALAGRDWVKYMVTFNRPDRPIAWLQTRELMTPQERYEAAGHVWEDSESTFRERWLWIDIFHKATEYERMWFMSEDEWKVFGALPDEFTIYRGYHSNNERSLSYTLSEPQAEWFAFRYDGMFGPGYVVELRVKKADCFAYKNGRKEREIIVRPYGKLHWIKTRGIRVYSTDQPN